MKQTIRLTESDIHKIIKETVKKVLRESAKVDTFELYRWDRSAIDSDTVYCYFKQPNNDMLLLVEYWADEDKVAPYAQFCDLRGDIEEDDGRLLTNSEITYFTNVCRKIIFNQNES